MTHLKHHSRPADNGFSAIRKTYSRTDTLNATADQVFPLLCPVLEYEWLDGWSCDLKYSDSGVAEDNCIFTTEISGHSTWVVSRYEPAAHIINFVVLFDSGVVMRLNISVVDQAGGTCAITWERIFTAISPEGLVELAKSTDQFLEEQTTFINKSIEYYLAHGTMLKTSFIRKHHGH